MPSHFFTILLVLIFLAPAAGPVAVLPQAKTSHNCHKEPVEMPVACAVHCLSNALHESEVNFNLTPSAEFFAPTAINDHRPPETPWVSSFDFNEAAVFRDSRIILATVKRE